MVLQFLSIAAMGTALAVVFNFLLNEAVERHARKQAAKLGLTYNGANHE